MNEPREAGVSHSYYRRLRLAHGLTQVKFWGAVGVTQSSGSKYEEGRDVSASIAELVRLKYVVGVDFATINALDLKAVDLLMVNFPEKYQRILNRIAAARGESRQKVFYTLEGLVYPAP